MGWVLQSQQGLGVESTSFGYPIVLRNEYRVYIVCVVHILYGMLSIYGIHSIYTPFSIYIVYMVLYVLADMCIFV